MKLHHLVFGAFLCGTVWLSGADEKSTNRLTKEVRHELVISPTTACSTTSPTE